VEQRTNSELVAAVDDVLLQTLSLVRDLSEDDGLLPTDCPAWNVRDVLAHMVGLEQVLQGAPQPTVELPPSDHVRTEFDEYMEQHVYIRRLLPLAAIADELAGLRSRRTPTLRALAERGDPDVTGPFGTNPMSKSLPIRVFDLWAHEQDIRRAVGVPVRTECVAAEVSMERVLIGWRRAVPGLVGRPATVTIRVTDPQRSETVIAVDGGAGASARLVGDIGLLTWLFCGRGAPPDGTLTGDPEVVDALRGGLGLTP
jgi:uncharacterized protein (TIGR03083 family)